MSAMTDLTSTRSQRAVDDPHAPTARTSALLACGAAVGPLFLVVAVVQMLLRDGFDLSRHALSLLSNGPGGWIQIGNFCLAGVLVIATASGMRRVLTPGPGATWGPRLLAAHGAGLIAAGVFPADPSTGFPAGAPAGAPESLSWHGIAHAVAFGVAQLSVLAACFVLARAFAAHRMRRWARYTLGTGLVVPVILLVPVPVGFGVRAFSVTVVIFAWITASAARLLHARR